MGLDFPRKRTIPGSAKVKSQKPYVNYINCDELASADGYLSRPHDIWNALDEDEDDCGPDPVRQ